jgi:recombinational DNA repair protein RecR
MSTALAAARKRRAPASLAPEPPLQQSSQNAQAPPSAGLTLPQVIAVIDKRLITLEQFVKSQQQNEVTVDIRETGNSPAVAEIIEEFNSRYTILAEEIDNLKNIVLNLQSYTMNVNKTLLEERIQVLSDTDVMPRKNITISMDSETRVDYLEQIGGEFTLENTAI